MSSTKPFLSEDAAKTSAYLSESQATWIPKTKLRTSHRLLLTRVRNKMVTDLYPSGASVLMIACKTNPVELRKPAKPIKAGPPILNQFTQNKVRIKVCMITAILRMTMKRISTKASLPHARCLRLEGLPAEAVRLKSFLPIQE